jgi:hypothetical protein
VIFRRDGRESNLVWALSLDGALEGVSGQWTASHAIVNLTPAHGAPRELRWDLSADSARLRVNGNNDGNFTFQESTGREAK